MDENEDALSTEMSSTWQERCRISGGWFAGGILTPCSSSVLSSKATLSTREYTYAREIGLILVSAYCEAGMVNTPSPFIVIFYNAGRTRAFALYACLLAWRYNALAMSQRKEMSAWKADIRVCAGLGRKCMLPTPCDAVP